MTRSGKAPAMWLAIGPQSETFCRRRPASSWADDYQRTQELEALAIGFAVMIVATFARTIFDAAEIGSTRQGFQITQAVGLLAWIGVRGWKLRPSA